MFRKTSARGLGIKALSIHGLNLLCMLAVLLAATPSVRAQDATGTVFGTVTDASGAIIPGAQVTILSKERGVTRITVSNSKGEYTFPQLQVGTYQVRVVAPSFETFLQNDILIDAAQSAKVDAKLIVGNVDTTVTVASNAGIIDTRSATIGTLIDNTSVQELPIDGNNVTNLAALLPGVTSVNAPASFTGDRSGPTFSASGSRVGQNLFLFDGIIYNNLFRNTGSNFPPREAIQEIQVLTNNYGAEYGRNAGAIFSVVSRSGTNSFHGQVWEVAKNDAFNATNYLSGKAGNHLVQNQYGATFGGPIFHNKMFFFVGYQGFRLATNGTTVPTEFTSAQFTDANTDAVFSATTKDPVTGKAFPGGVIPHGRFDPTAVNLITTFGLTSPSGRPTVVTFAPQRSDLGIGRIDYNRGRQSFDLRYFALNSESTAISGSLYNYNPQTNNAPSFITSLGHTFIVSPNVVNVAHLGYRRYKVQATPGDTRTLATFGSKLPSFGAPTLPSITVTSGFTLSNSSNTLQTSINENVEINDSVSWIRGTHSFKFGGNYLRLQYLNRSNANTQGVFNFSGGFTGTGLADFLLGLPNQLIIASPILEQSGIQHEFFFYAQDQWRATSNLTISYGLRYELPFNWFQPQNHWGTFRQGVQSSRIPTAPVGLLFVGDPGISRGIVKTDRNNIGPRVGFSYDPLKQGRTVIRGGYGVFFDAINADVIQNTGQPYQYKFTYSNVASLSDPLKGQAPIPTTVNLSNPQFVGTPTLNFPDANLTSPYVQQYNFGFQQALPRSIFLEADYVGRLSRKLFVPVTFNPAVYNPTCGTSSGACSASTDARRLIQGFGDLEDIATIGTANYNGLQVRLTRRARSVTVNSSYTWSRSLDTGSSYDSESGYLPTPFNLGSNYGPSDFNAAQVFTLGYVVNLPSFSKHNIFLREALGGWIYTGIYNARTGSPLNITLGVDQAASSTPNQRPVYLHNPNLPQNREKRTEIAQFFDTSAFGIPALGQLGNVSRNSVTGPGQITNNMGLGKAFALPFLGETGRLEYRCEALGVFNTPNLKPPTGSNLQTGVPAVLPPPGQPLTTIPKGFGALTNSTGERQLQMTLRLTY